MKPAELLRAMFAAAVAGRIEEYKSQPSYLVITRYQHGETCQHIEVVEAGHPLPDLAGQTAAERMLGLLQGLTEQDLVLCLLSGGGSSLLSLPPLSVSLQDKRNVTQALLKCGATIHEINCVRKHLSCIKGGRLAIAAAPSRVVSLVISDVPGDEVSVIASGPTTGDPTTREQAAAVLHQYAVAAPASVLAWLNNPLSETPKPGDVHLANVQNAFVATPKASLQAAARIAEQVGIVTVILGDDLEGEARDCAIMHAELAKQCANTNSPAKPPCALISGGETTITVRGSGRGGRNAEFLLSLGIALDGQADTWAIACDTDGIDGTETNAGALIGPDFLQEAASLQLNPRAFLANNDAYSMFAQTNHLVTTGPTRTNVNDFRALYIGKNMGR
jgi:hydroxypyruvate reductase